MNCNTIRSNPASEPSSATATYLSVPPGLPRAQRREHEARVEEANRKLMERAAKAGK